MTVTASLTPPTPSAASTVVISDSWTGAFFVAVCMPDSVKVSVYCPGGSAGNWYDAVAGRHRDARAGQHVGSGFDRDAGQHAAAACRSTLP